MDRTYFFCLLTILMATSCGPRKRVQYHPPARTEFDTCTSIECLTRLVEKTPQSAEAHDRLGMAYYSVGDKKKALNLLSNAIALDSTYKGGFTFMFRAICKNNLGNDTGAVSDMNNAIRINPEERYFYMERADFLYNLDSLDPALRDYTKALSLFDREARARLGRAKVLVCKWEYAAALGEYGRVSEGEMTSTEDIYFRGRARFHMKDAAGACADWTSVAGLSENACDSARVHCGGIRRERQTHHK